MFGGKIGTTELIIILVIVLLIFGGAKIVDLAKSMGKAKVEFKKAQEEADKEEKLKVAAAQKDSEKSAQTAQK
jgi:sec-independent protein translocase protein TatA